MTHLDQITKQVFDFSLPIAGSAPRGVWRLEMFADLEAPALASKTFLVEDFLPERIDFEVKTDAKVLKSGESVDATLKASWLYGAPAAKRQVWRRITLEHTAWRFTRYAERAAEGASKPPAV